ncbi:MAG: hypothetical protein Q8N95_01365 [Desulfobacterales bacterium]|nr:hypothetical protein [Desulfobacterales bacterium]
MYKLWTKLTGVAAAALMVIPDVVLAAGEKASLLVIVADTRKLTGWQAWFANLYNESHLYFTIVTVVAIPIIGVILGFLADLVMSRIGIDLKSRELSEH